MVDTRHWQHLQSVLVMWRSVLAHWQSLGLPDFLAVTFTLLLILMARIGNKLFIGFVSSRPEGRKTVIGNLLFVSIFFYHYTFLFSPSEPDHQYLLRMLFGVFGSIWVIGVYYTFRISLIFITSLLTTKTILHIYFIMDFHTMTGQRK